METKDSIKSAMRIGILLAVLAAGYAAIVYAHAFSNSIQPSQFRSFSVSGEGEVVAVPDVGKFSFSVVSEGGKDLAKLQEENVGKMNKIIDAVKANGVDAKDIQTQQYSVEPRYQHYNCNPTVIYQGGTTGSAAVSSSARPCPPPDIVGYTVRQSASVKIRDFEKAGDIISKTTDLGANSVSQLSFEVDDRAKFESEAREKAIAQAKEKAEKVAQAGGFRVGKLLSIDEGYQPVPYYSRDTMAMGGAMMEKSMNQAAAPTIEPGSQELKVTVNLRYEIK